MGFIPTVAELKDQWQRDPSCRWKLPLALAVIGATGAGTIYKELKRDHLEERVRHHEAMLCQGQVVCPDLAMRAWYPRPEERERIRREEAMGGCSGINLGETAVQRMLAAGCPQVFEQRGEKVFKHTAVR